MDDNKQILNTSDNAAQYKTGIYGWVDRHGRYFGKEEVLARYSGCTHIECPQCNKTMPKGYTICSDCRKTKADTRYKTMESKQWDGETPLYSQTADEYFYDEDDMIDFVTENKCSIESLQLVICEPNMLKQIEEDYFCDSLSDDGELPDDVFEAIEAFNEVIMRQKPMSWFPGKYAVDIKIY